MDNGLLNTYLLKGNNKLGMVMTRTLQWRSQMGPGGGAKEVSPPPVSALQTFQKIIRYFATYLGRQNSSKMLKILEG